jgi:hypothetical protein
MKRKSYKTFYRLKASIWWAVSPLPAGKKDL